MSKTPVNPQPAPAPRPPTQPPTPRPQPAGPTHPPRVVDDLMVLADAVFQSPVRQFPPGACAPGGPVQISGRGGKGAVERAPRPVMPVPLGPPRFGGDDKPQPGNPNPPTGPPHPFPPPMRP